MVVPRYKSDVVKRFEGTRDLGGLGKGFLVVVHEPPSDVPVEIVWEGVEEILSGLGRVRNTSTVRGCQLTVSMLAINGKLVDAPSFAVIKKLHRWAAER